MANLVETILELQRIFDEIELNDGVIEDEMVERLEIAEEQFAGKMDSYRNVVMHMDKQMQLIEEETARLKNKINTITNSRKYLVEIMIGAIKRFGTETKTSWQYKTDTYTLTVRKSKSTEVDEKVAREYFDTLESRIKAAAVDAPMMIGVKAEHVISNLKAEDINELYNFLREKNMLSDAKIKLSESKTILKEVIELRKEDSEVPNELVGCAYIKENESLMFK